MACKAQEQPSNLEVCMCVLTNAVEVWRMLDRAFFFPFLLPCPCLPGIELIKEKRWAFQRALPLPAAALYTNMLACFSQPKALTFEFMLQRKLLGPASIKKILFHALLFLPLTYVHSGSVQVWDQLGWCFKEFGALFPISWHFDCGVFANKHKGRETILTRPHAFIPWLQ